MKNAHLCLPLLLLGMSTGFTEDGPTYNSVKTARIGIQTVYGLVSPLDQDGKDFYLRNVDGLIEVRLTEQTKVGLLFRERNIRGMLDDRRVKIASADREFALPERLYVKVYFASWRAAQGVLNSGRFRNGFVFAQPLPDHLPTEKEPWLSGELTATEPGHITPVKVVTVGDRTFKGSTGGFNYAEQIAALFDHSVIEPFVNQASVYGEMKGKVFHADYVFLRPIPDQVAKDDRSLPRYLFIGDSISLNYAAGLRKALHGKLNIHHPPTNCGPSGKGKNSMQAWLGDYQRKGRHWDVISFNFGHWDAGNTKDVYQANLENIIRQLNPTGDKLIWVTTCPVPNGYEPAGELGPDGKATGRTAGVMKKYLNRWAGEVVARHPEISVCNQWQFVKDREQDLYREWWVGKNVHFRGEPADALGQFLAEHVLKAVEMK